jgi:hypothetical protein
MIRGLLLGTALVLGAAGVRAAAAQLGEGRNLSCESSGRLVRCQAALTRRGARLVRQVSNAPCLQGQTWGFERNASVRLRRLRRDLGKGECLSGDTRGHPGTSIWATRGCRGEFEVILADGGRRAE